MKLYHGTSSEKLEKIKNKGLREPFLTSSLGLAEYYAIENIEEFGGKKIILKVDVAEENLEIDYPAIYEPVAFDDYSIDELEEKVDNMLENMREKHPEWIDDGYLDLPKECYRISLDTVASCRCNINVSWDKIKMME